MGYFSLEPKRRLEDFYDMEGELKLFVDSLRKFRLVVVRGLRRYGKTSLILTGLNCAGARYVFVDCRLLPLAAASFEDFLSLLEVELSRGGLKDLLRSVEFVEVGGFVRFRVRRPEVLVRVFEDLGDVVVVFDEAQELRRLRFRMDYLIAYVLDHLKARFVVSGSQVGLLYRFLRIEDPEAPLYGRPYGEVVLKPLSRERAVDFLRRGFAQEGVDVSGELIDRAVDVFGGVIGWLSYFGYCYVRDGEDLEAIALKASKLALSELQRFLETRGVAAERYAEALKVIALLGEASWSEIKRGLQAKVGHIPDTALANILRNLVDAGIVVKKEQRYVVADPIVWRAVRELL